MVLAAAARSADASLSARASESAALTVAADPDHHGYQRGINPDRGGPSRHQYVPALAAMFLSDTFALIRPEQALRPAWPVPCFEPNSSRHPKDFLPRVFPASKNAGVTAADIPRPLCYFVRLHL